MNKSPHKSHWYSVRTTPSLVRGRGTVGYWVRLWEYRRSINRRGLPFNKFEGFVHISNDLFSTRKEALAFGRKEAAKREA